MTLRYVRTYCNSTYVCVHACIVSTLRGTYPSYKVVRLGMDKYTDAYVRTYLRMYIHTYIRMYVYYVLIACKRLYSIVCFNGVVYVHVFSMYIALKTTLYIRTYIQESHVNLDVCTYVRTYIIHMYVCSHTCTNFVCRVCPVSELSTSHGNVLRYAIPTGL